MPDRHARSARFGRYALTSIFLALSLLQTAAAEGQPRLGLVLSGGGARGLAHVGVLKVLER